MCLDVWIVGMCLCIVVEGLVIVFFGGCGDCVYDCFKIWDLFRCLGVCVGFGCRFF